MNKVPGNSVPNGWRLAKLGDVAKVGSGKAPQYSNGTVPVIGANGKIGLTTESNFDLGLAVGRVGASGSVHRITAPSWLSDNVLSVEPDEMNTRLGYLHYALDRANLPQLASKTAQPLLTQTALGAVTLVLPPLHEQRRIAEVLDSIDEAIERAESVITSTEQLRDALLHDLLTKGRPRLAHRVERHPQHRLDTRLLGGG